MYTDTNTGTTQREQELAAALAQAQQALAAATQALEQQAQPEAEAQAQPAPEKAPTIHTRSDWYQRSPLLRSAFAWRNGNKARVMDGRKLYERASDVRELFRVAVEGGWNPPDAQDDPFRAFMPDRVGPDSAQDSQAHDAPANPPQESSNGLDLDAGDAPAPPRATVAPSAGRITGNAGDRLSKALARYAADDAVRYPVTFEGVTGVLPFDLADVTAKRSSSLQKWVKDALTAAFAPTLANMTPDERTAYSVRLANALGFKGERAHAFSGYRTQDDWVSEAARLVEPLIAQLPDADA